MLKHTLEFIHNHIDILQVLGAGAGGVGVLFLDIEFILKLLLTSLSGGYIIWKWRVEYLKNKKENSKPNE